MLKKHKNVKKWRQTKQNETKQHETKQKKHETNWNKTKRNESKWNIKKLFPLNQKLFQTLFTLVMHQDPSGPGTALLKSTTPEKSGSSGSCKVAWVR